MVKKNYSAGLVSRRFWFYEIKQYMELLNDGESESDIKRLSENANIFGAPSTSRAKEIYGESKKRVNLLGDEMRALFFDLNIDSQKLVIFIAVLLSNDLLLEFMLEVFQEEINKGKFLLTQKNYQTFFSEKQRTNEVVARWKPYTYQRLGSAYKKYLLDAGLIREEGTIDRITPKILDLRVQQWLVKMNRLDILQAITGGRQ